MTSQQSKAPLEYGKADASFQAAGGEAGIRKLVDDFYDEMSSLGEARHIREMHPDNLTMSRDKLARFLCGWLGGPRLYQETYGPISIPKAHSHLSIGPAERDAWLLCMEKSIARQSYHPDFARYLLTQLAIPAERCRNQP